MLVEINEVIFAVEGNYFPEELPSLTGSSDAWTEGEDAYIEVTSCKVKDTEFELLELLNEKTIVKIEQEMLRLAS